MRTMLVQRKVAEYCFLSEAINWIAFSEYPEERLFENDTDARFTASIYEEYETSNIDNPYNLIEGKLCERVGLPISPRWKKFNNNDDSLEEAWRVDELLTRDLPKHDKEKLLKERKKAVELERKQRAWEETYTAFIEPIQLKFLLALREAKITAYGRMAAPLKKGIDSSEWHNDDSFYHRDDWYKQPHTPIPSECFRVDGIDWDENMLKSAQGLFVHVLVPTKQLFSLYPEPEMQPVTVLKFDNRYFLDTQQNADELPQISKGRPSYPWEEFHVEIARRVAANNIPDKLEAWVAEMQEWCQKRWNKRVSRSIMHPKLSSYHRAFKKSKNTTELSE